MIRKTFYILSLIIFSIGRLLAVENNSFSGEEKIIWDNSFKLPDFDGKPHAGLECFPDLSVTI